MKMDTTLELYQKCIIPMILYGNETWADPEKQCKLIEPIRINVSEHFLNCQTAPQHQQ